MQSLCYYTLLVADCIGERHNQSSRSHFALAGGGSYRRRGVSIKLIILCCGLISSFVGAEIFTISSVVNAKEKNAVSMVLDNKGHRMEYFVSKDAIISGIDVVAAFSDFTRIGRIDVFLKEAGKKKLGDFSRKAVLGQRRLAVVIDQKLVAVVVLKGEISGDFVLDGLEGMSKQDREKIAGAITRSANIDPETKNDQSPSGKGPPSGNAESSSDSRPTPRQLPDGPPPEDPGSAPE